MLEKFLQDAKRARQGDGQQEGSEEASLRGALVELVQLPLQSMTEDEARASLQLWASHVVPCRQ
jgi:hypothetical protein